MKLIDHIDIADSNSSVELDADFYVTYTNNRLIITQKVFDKREMEELRLFLNRLHEEVCL